MNTASALGSAGLVAIFAAACGITVVVPGQTGDPTGAGGESAKAGVGPVGAGGGSSEASTGESGTGGKGAGGCATTCSAPPSGETCTCALGCGDEVGGAFEKISCAPTVDLEGNHKVECVCSVQDFSGVCFEHDLAHLCDPSGGCCAKYFSGK